MTHFDVFNGDADGLCGLHQLRLAHPRDSVLVSGTKRDIALLGRVAAAPGDSVSVLDISFAVNAAAARRLLAVGVSIEYFDHHHPGEVPDDPRLVTHIDTGPEVCTGIIVDRVLGGRHRLWAIVAAFGDNLHTSAFRLAHGLGLDAVAIAALQGLGEDLAYNGYGDDEADLILHPVELYLAVRPYADPFLFLRSESVWRRIRATREEDMAQARAVKPLAATAGSLVVCLPDTAWSRRVRGALANELAQAAPERAHAVVSREGDGCLMVSVRAPIARPRGADALCRGFEHGGGREAAAGINHLPVSELGRFVRAFHAAYG